MRQPTNALETLPRASGPCRSGEPFLGALAAAEPAAAFGVRVHLCAEEERQAAEPQPREHDDDSREGAPRLVVGAELARVDRESGRDDEPGDNRDRGAEAEERPPRVLDVRPEIEQACEDHDQPEDQERPLTDEPGPADRGLGADRVTQPP